jgi:hypothetical protein
MSSIIVKGMRIPDNCIKCPLQFGGWCYVSPPEIDERVAPTVDEAVERGKPEWCPLVDLGKHGDLIDRDELKTEFPKDTDWEYPVNTNQYVCEMIDKAKTVIEAEEEA